MSQPISNVMTETYFDNVPVSKMFVPTYGRNASKTIVAKLSAHFDIKALGTLYLSYREDTDTYAIIDGQHRMLAAVQNGYDVLPGRVYLGLTYEQEAYLYGLFATVNKQMALDRFKANLEAKDPLALSILDSLEGLGLKVGFTGPQSGEIRAIGQIYTLIEQYDFDFFVQTFTLIRDIWSFEPGAYTMDFIHGVAGFLSRYRSIMDRERLITRLQPYTARNITLKALAQKQLLSKTESKMAVGIVMMEEYNEGLRKNKLPAWKATKYYKTMPPRKKGENGKFI